MDTALGISRSSSASTPEIGGHCGVMECTTWQIPRNSSGRGKRPAPRRCQRVVRNSEQGKNQN